MSKKTKVLILLFLSATISYSQKNFFENKDNWLINNIVEKVDSSEQLLKFYKKYTNAPNHVYLGFKHNVFFSVVQGNKIRFECEFYFYKDSLISFVLRPKIKGKDQSKKKYFNLLKGRFKIENDSVIEPLKYNFDYLKEPLDYFVGEKLSNKEIDYYMSTESGLNYGIKSPGSFTIPTTLENRENFLKLNSKTPELILQLMYSKNPASRFTAIEYYYRNMNKFEDKDVKVINSWIKKVFKDIPEIKRVEGCFLVRKKSKEFVIDNSKILLLPAFSYD